jgi:hypothetical protein
MYVTLVWPTLLLLIASVVRTIVIMYNRLTTVVPFIRRLGRECSILRYNNNIIKTYYLLMLTESVQFLCV